MIFSVFINELLEALDLRRTTILLRELYLGLGSSTNRIVNLHNFCIRNNEACFGALKSHVTPSVPKKLSYPQSFFVPKWLFEFKCLSILLMDESLLVNLV